MKLGAEPKKLAMLGGLLLLAVDESYCLIAEHVGGISNLFHWLRAAHD